jgi:uncharacterized protein YdhG (YjbR/CyaY superfamily)
MPAKTVDEYLHALPAAPRAALEQLLGVISTAAPDAVETMSYGVPTFKLAGRPLVSYGAAKAHCAFYVMSTEALEPFAAELKPYSTGKGTVRFPPGEPLPADLVQRLVTARIAENEKR